MARRIRDRAAERRRRNARLKAEGFSQSQIRGHPKKGERTIAAVRGETKRTRRTVRQVLDTDRALGTGAARSSRVVEDGRNDAARPGSILDTHSKRDAMRFLRDAAREGRSVQIIGTKQDGTGVPLYGAGRGTTAAGGLRPQPVGQPFNTGGSQGTGERGRIKAADFLRIVRDDYDGELWDAIGGEDGGHYAWSTASVVAVHIFVAA